MAEKKKFVYGLSELVFNDTTIGYIEKDSFDWGGKDAESVDVNAEQVPGQPVLVLMQKNGTVEPTFNLIQLDAENIAAVMGGTLKDGKWSAPTGLVQVSGKVKIITASNHTIEAPNAILASNFTGKLALSEVTKIKVTLKIQQPTDGSSPLTIDGLATSTSTTTTETTDTNSD